MTLFRRSFCRLVRCSSLPALFSLFLFVLVKTTGLEPRDYVSEFQSGQRLFE